MTGKIREVHLYVGSAIFVFLIFLALNQAYPPFEENHAKTIESIAKASFQKNKEVKAVKVDFQIINRTEMNGDIVVQYKDGVRSEVNCRVYSRLFGKIETVCK